MNPQLNADERKALTNQLGKMMSDISEDCYYAGWLGGTEYLVPELCRRASSSGDSQPWGHSEVTPQNAAVLMEIARQLGHWADLDEPGIAFEPHDPFPIPIQYLNSLDMERENAQSRRDDRK